MPSESQKPLKSSVEKVAAECTKAGATKWEVMRVVKVLSSAEGTQVSGGREAAGTGALSIAEMRSLALEELRKSNPEAAREFARFGEMRVHTSAETLEGFDRGNITKSLLKETALSRSLAERISNEVEDELKEMKIKYLNTALIRNLVNAKLLALGYEDAYCNYARLGVPVHDIAAAVSQGAENSAAGSAHDAAEKFGREAMREYAWAKVIPSPARELHFSGDMHICAVHDFASKPYAYAKFFAPPAECGSAEEALALLAAEIAWLNRLITLPVCADSVNASLSPLLEKMQRKRFAEIARLFFLQMKCVQCKELPACELPAHSATLYLEGELEKYGAHSESAIEFANSLVRESAAALRFCILLDTKYKLGLLERKVLGERNISFLNYGETKPAALNGGLFLRSGRGISMLAGINMPKLALEAKDGQRFLSSLGERLKVLHELGELKGKILQGNSALKKAGINHEELKPVLGLFGFFESCEMLAKGKSARLAEKALQEIADALPEWEICEFCNDRGIIRFNAQNKRKHGYEFHALGAEEREKFLGSKIIRERYNFTLGAQNMRTAGELLEKGVGMVVSGA
ncbi:MAG: ATP cone domain-containing protein [Candidatus Diapherotrites archaeon]